MASKANSLKLYLLLLSLLSFSFSLLIYTSIFQLKPHPLFQDHPTYTKKKHSPTLEFLKKGLKGREIKIGLVNMHEVEEVEEWKGFGTSTTIIAFDRVAKKTNWKEYFPEWIDEDEKWDSPKCPDIPMPIFENYSKDFDLVVVKMPCGKTVQGEGTRDVFRLQVNLVAANLVVKNGDDRDVFVVFVGSCQPMLEIFRCDDLVRHDAGLETDQFWIYKPDLRRLEQKITMPVGSCQLAVSHRKQGGSGGKVEYDFSKVSNPIDHPKEAYVTVLHSSELYVCGAIALAQSILQTNSTKDLVLLADRSITKKSRQGLRSAGWKVKDIERIRSPHAEKDAYNEWNYSKLRIWQLTEYNKIIFIDADLVILRNIDNFFLYPQVSAVGNDQMLFNSGIMLIEPSQCVFKMLMKKMHTLNSYNGGDQGFLNEAFTWWHRWPTRLNFLKNFEDEKDQEHKVPESIYTIHYLGLKPWMCYRDYDCNWDMLNHHRFASDSAHWRWWKVYDAMPKRLQAFCSLSEEMDARIRKWRGRAENASLPDKHWMIKVKDPRQRNGKRN